MRLAGKVAIVSGAASGMGAATARMFAREGAKVVIVDVLEHEGRQVANAIGASARFEPLDVTKEESWAAVVAATTRHFGKLDVLVNNAGRRQSAAAQEIGMSASPGAPPPRFNLKSYTRTVDYDTPSMRDEFVRTQAEPGARGGGGVPLVGEQRQLQVVSGTQAWNQVGDASPTPQLAAVADRLHPSF